MGRRTADASWEAEADVTCVSTLSSHATRDKGVTTWPQPGKGTPQRTALALTSGGTGSEQEPLEGAVRTSRTGRQNAAAFILGCTPAGPKNQVQAGPPSTLCLPAVLPGHFRPSVREGSGQLRGASERGRLWRRGSAEHGRARGLPQRGTFQLMTKLQLVVKSPSEDI